jgi:hypothetical protein
LVEVSSPLNSGIGPPPSNVFGVEDQLPEHPLKVKIPTAKHRTIQSAFVALMKPIMILFRRRLMDTLPGMTTKPTSGNVESFIDNRNGGAMQDLLQNIANFSRRFRF